MAIASNLAAGGFLLRYISFGGQESGALISAICNELQILIYQIVKLVAV